MRQDLECCSGDIRNCILALANTGPSWKKLLRTVSGRNAKGQSFGNLFLAAMDGICSSFEQAVQRIGCTGGKRKRVLPVTCRILSFARNWRTDVIVGESK